VARLLQSLKIARDDLVGNVMRSREFATSTASNKLGKPVDRAEWGMTPQTVNAYYSPELNEVVFPAARLQYPAVRCGRRAGDQLRRGRHLDRPRDQPRLRRPGRAVRRRRQPAQLVDQGRRREVRRARQGAGGQYGGYSPLPGYT
jgi:putative endopeptidase